MVALSNVGVCIATFGAASQHRLVTRLQQEPPTTAVEGCDAAMPGGMVVSVLPPDANTAIAFFGGLAGFLGLAVLLSTAAVVLKPKLARVPALYYFANIVHLGARHQLFRAGKRRLCAKV